MAVKDNLDVKVNPDLVSVLEVESDLALGSQKVDFETNAVFEVTKDVANINAGNRDAQTDFVCVRIDVTGDLCCRKKC